MVILLYRDIFMHSHTALFDRLFTCQVDIHTDGYIGGNFDFKDIRTFGGGSQHTQMAVCEAVTVSMY